MKHSCMFPNVRMGGKVHMCGNHASESKTLICLKQACSGSTNTMTCYLGAVHIEMVGHYREIHIVMQSSDRLCCLLWQLQIKGPTCHVVKLQIHDGKIRFRSLGKVHDNFGILRYQVIKDECSGFRACFNCSRNLQHGNIIIIWWSLCRHGLDVGNLQKDGKSRMPRHWCMTTKSEVSMPSCALYVEGRLIAVCIKSKGLEHIIQVDGGTGCYG